MIYRKLKISNLSLTFKRHRKETHYINWYGICLFTQLFKYFKFWLRIRGDIWNRKTFYRQPPCGELLATLGVVYSMRGVVLWNFFWKLFRESTTPRNIDTGSRRKKIRDREIIYWLLKDSPSLSNCNSLTWGSIVLSLRVFKGLKKELPQTVLTSPRIVDNFLLWIFPLIRNQNRKYFSNCARDPCRNYYHKIEDSVSLSCLSNFLLIVMNLMLVL